MNSKGAVYTPELIAIMKAVLDDASASRKRMIAEIASHILECAAKGQRDPVALKTAALSRRGLHAQFPRYLSGAQCSLTLLSAKLECPRLGDVARGKHLADAGNSGDLGFEPSRA
jgi:hypothetical protein